MIDDSIVYLWAHKTNLAECSYKLNATLLQEIMYYGIS